MNTKQILRWLYVGLPMLLAVMALGLLASLGRAQGMSATVQIMPASQEVSPQTSYTFTVMITDVQDLGGFEFDLAFDPTLLQVDDVTLGDFLGSTGRTTVEVGPTIDNNAGTLTYGAFTFGEQAGPNGAGVLAIVDFTTSATLGTSVLDLQEVQVLNTDAEAQSVQVEDGTVSILAGPRIGTPTYADSVPSDEALLVSVPITNTTSDSGVSIATLRYGYTAPYTQSVVAGSGQGGNGDGTWSFLIPPQGVTHEGQTLFFSIAAQDGDTPPGETIADNDGNYYSVSILMTQLTSTPTATATNTPSNTPTSINTSTATATISTNTPTATSTMTPTAETPTPTPSKTWTATSTMTPTVGTPTPTPNKTWTATSTMAPTVGTPTPTLTRIPTVTNTPPKGTLTPTATPSRSPTNTPTNTPTSIYTPTNTPHSSFTLYLPVVVSSQ